MSHEAAAIATIVLSVAVMIYFLLL